MTAAPGRSGACAELLIVADDLTGALDTAGAFASIDDPVRVPLASTAARSGRRAFDTDSRDLPEEEAVARVTDLFGRGVGEGTEGLAFKKVDSVMRGHPVAEAVAAFRSGGFQRALLAPAFPEMGRITQGGQQYAVSSGRRQAVGLQLVEALRGHGVSAAMLGDGGQSKGFLVADAASRSDLDSAVQAFGDRSRTLFVGSAGLAGALSPGPVRRVAVPPIDLAVCGTRHPVTLRQIEMLGQEAAERVELDAAGPIARGPAVFIAPREAVEEERARTQIALSLQRLVEERPRPRAALVTGGWTLRLLTRICMAEMLVCIGLYAPGIPVCRVVGGLWDRALLVSKSGGFGREDLLVRLFASSPG